MNYKGKGEHSVNELEKICEDFKEVLYQRHLKIQDLQKHINGFASQDKWISVETLPKKASFVIAHKKSGLVLGLYFNADNEFKYGKEDQTNQITHWQPLPKSLNTK